MNPLLDFGADTARSLHIRTDMRQILEKLFALQKIQLGALPSTKNQPEILRLRQQVPESLLRNFDRLVTRGKTAIALARNGVCSECHLRIPSGKLASLAYTSEIHICDNCHRYLYLPEDEPLGLTDPPPKAPSKSPKKRVARQVTAHVA